jgi:hypothetical protein
METGKSTRIKWVEYVCDWYGTRIRVVGDVYTGTRLHTSLGNRIVEVVSRQRAGGSGVRIQNFQTGSGVHSVFHSMGTEFLYWVVTRLVREVSHSLPRLWVGRAVPLLPLYAFLARTRATLLYSRNIKHVTASVLSSRLWTHKSLRPSRLLLSHCICFRISPHPTSLLVSLLPLTVHLLF